MIPESASLTKAKATEVAPHERAETASNQGTIWIWRLLKVTLLLLVMCSAFFLYAYRSMHIPPEFYRQNLQQPFAELEIAGDQFETKLLNVQNAIRQQPNWRGVFREAEINGWMAADCPSKFPELTPNIVEAPRIQILDSEFRYAFRYRPGPASKWFLPFIVIAGDIFVAEPAGEIALRIKQVKSGIIPIPITRIADNMTEHLRGAGLDVAWSEMEGDPMALISVPPDRLRVGDQRFRVDTIICRNQEIELIGESVKFNSATK
jgi:hypothetical protein